MPDETPTWTPEFLEERRVQIDAARKNLLFGAEGAITPEAEQHVMLALAALETAIAHLSIGRYCLMQRR